MITKILIGLFSLILSKAVFSEQRQVYRECESGSWVIPNFIVYIQYDLVKNNYGTFFISKYSGTSGGKYLANNNDKATGGTASAYKLSNGDMMYHFSFYSSRYDRESESHYPEGTHQFNIYIEEGRTHYQSEYWVWDKTRGWGWGDVVREDCFRIKGKP